MYLMLKTLFLFAGLSRSAGQVDAPTADDATVLRMSHQARKPAAKGTRIRIPAVVLANVKANPDDCAESRADEPYKLDAFRVSLNSKGESAIVVWGRSSCYCSPTGNCDFWVFHKVKGKYEMLLQTEMVRNYGFLTTKTNGYRDFAAWSHDSAQRSPARLYRFDGEAYQVHCGWEEAYEYEGPNETWVSVTEPRIEQNSCGEKKTEKP